MQMSNDPNTFHSYWNIWYNENSESYPVCPPLFFTPCTDHKLGNKAKSQWSPKNGSLGYLDCRQKSNSEDLNDPLYNNHEFYVSATEVRA